MPAANISGPSIRRLRRRAESRRSGRALTTIGRVNQPIDYAAAGPLTRLGGIDPRVLEGLPEDPPGICWPVHGLILQPDEAQRLDLPPVRFEDNQVRPAHRLIQALLALNPAPLTVLRPPRQRVVGTCRHFALLACALLRHRAVPARVRCGFATYFVAGQALDHWIVEHWSFQSRRWVRVDPEVLGGGVIADPYDLQPGQFLTGGEAWSAYRRGEVDASTFGVAGTANWGAGEIRGNLVKDLAALNKVEMLPWDEWGQMEPAYRGATGPRYDALLDTVARAGADDDVAALTALFATPDLTVPAPLIR